MLVVLVVLLAVVALVLLMLLLQARAAAGSTRDALAAAEQTRDAEITRAKSLDDEVMRLNTELGASRAATEELESSQSALEERVSTAEARAIVVESERDTAAADRDTLQQQFDDATNQLETAKGQNEQRSAELDTRTAEVLDLTHENERLQVELVEAADEAAKQRTPTVPSVLISDDDAGLDVSGFSPGMAWELELVRSERTWRYSVAANPVEDPSPFDDVENSLKLAIEIEALALREDVGAFIGIDWQAGTTIDPADDPARSHLTLRLAQELLASAAREMSPSTLIVRPDAERGGVSLEVVASDPDDVDFKIPPPPIASEWIGIDEHGGMVVTVKVD